mmetsp:Transcript_49616/g.80059  ORF Transcript_49616/g.80059 Transcript_49616/m.80059 type:complete len:242 (+) Transcript_49616:19-744(+)
MGNASSSDDKSGENAIAGNWWECCGARENKSARGATKAVRELFDTNTCTPAPGTTTNNTVPTQKASLEEKLDDTDIQKIEKSSRTALRAAAPAPRIPSPDSIKVPEDKKEAGVGLLFNREEDKGWVVKTFIKGSPAQISGEIQGGDVLVSVNSKAIHDVSSLGALSKELMGTEGDSVELVFARGEIQHTVSLVRSNSFLGADGGKMMKQAVRKFGTWEATRKDFRPASTDEAVEEPGSVDL